MPKRHASNGALHTLMKRPPRERDSERDLQACLDPPRTHHRPRVEDHGDDFGARQLRLHAQGQLRELVEVGDPPPVVHVGRRARHALDDVAPLGGGGGGDVVVGRGKGLAAALLAAMLRLHAPLELEVWRACSRAMVRKLMQLEAGLNTVGREANRRVLRGPRGSRRSFRSSWSPPGT